MIRKAIVWYYEDLRASLKALVTDMDDVRNQVQQYTITYYDMIYYNMI